MSQHFGFVGVGRMGGAMAGRLLDAGHKLTIFDISEAAMAPLLARGAVRAGSPREVASAVATVFVSLPTPDIVHAVALGPDGLASGNRIKTYVDLSTTGPRMAADVAAALGQREITTIDSPVSGGVGGAKAGTLAVMVASPAEDFARLEPVLKTFGRVFHVGERAGLGQTMKLANNMLSAAAMAISSEAIVMGVKAGLDAQTMVDVINAGSGRNTATQDKFPKAILPRSFNYGFAAGLMLKDVKLCVEEAAALKVPMVVGAAVHKLWQQANTENGPASDITEIVRLMEKPTGVEVKGRS